MTKTNTTIYGKVVPHVEGFSHLHDGAVMMYFACGHARHLPKGVVDAQMNLEAVPVCNVPGCDGTAKVKTPYLCDAAPSPGGWCCSLRYGHAGDHDRTRIEMPLKRCDARSLGTQCIHFTGHAGPCKFEGPAVYVPESVSVANERDYYRQCYEASTKIIADLRQRNKNLDQALRSAEDKNASYKLLRDLDRTAKTHGWPWGDSEIEARKSQDYPILHSEPFYAKVRSIVRAMLREPKE